MMTSRVGRGGKETAMGQWVLDMWSMCVLGAVLLVGAVTDVRTGKVYNWITYPAIAVGLIGHALVGGVWGQEGARIGLAGSLAGLGVGFGPMLAAWLAGGIGGGDAKLMGAVGALGGWRFALAAMFYGLLVAAVMGLVVMLKQRIFRRTLMRVGRFLLLLVTPAKPGDPGTADSPKLPFGLALCIGGGMALAEILWRGPVARKLLLSI